MTTSNGRLILCLALWLLLSGQSSYKWDVYTSMLYPGTTAPERTSPDDSEVIFHATQFAGATTERYVMSDLGSETEILLYEKDSYRAEIIYEKSMPGSRTLIQIAENVGSVFGYFDGSPVAEIDYGYAQSPVGMIGYMRFTTPAVVCSDFYFEWESSERAFGAFFGVFEPSSLMGYVYNTGPSKFSHPDIADVLARLGVDGYEPNSDLTLSDGDSSVDSSSNDSSTADPSRDK